MTAIWLLGTETGLVRAEAVLIEAPKERSHVPPHRPGRNASFFFSLFPLAICGIPLSLLVPSVLLPPLLGPSAHHVLLQGGAPGAGMLTPIPLVSPSLFADLCTKSLLRTVAVSPLSRTSVPTRCTSPNPSDYGPQDRANPNMQENSSLCQRSVRYFQTRQVRWQIHRHPHSR